MRLHMGNESSAPASNAFKNAELGPEKNVNKIFWLQLKTWSLAFSDVSKKLENPILVASNKKTKPNF